MRKDRLAVDRPVADGRGEVWRAGTWQQAGTLTYDKYLTPQTLDVSAWDLNGPVRVRITHNGETAAHIDAVSLGGITPSAVSGTMEAPALALQKLVAAEYDVVHAQGRTLELTFNLGNQTATTFTLTARIEPAVIPPVPFQFPLENLYRPMREDARFYTYVWGSTPGTLTIDGDLAAEPLGAPFFQERTVPGTGHPEADIPMVGYPTTPTPCM